jgi:hypothetical protein
VRCGSTSAFGIGPKSRKKLITYLTGGKKIMMYVAKVENGQVSLYDASSGSYQRGIGSGNAVSAQVQGDTVAITLQDGRVEIYDANSGSYQRTI